MNIDDAYDICTPFQYRRDPRRGIGPVMDEHLRLSGLVDDLGYGKACTTAYDALTNLEAFARAGTVSLSCARVCADILEAQAAQMRVILAQLAPEVTTAE